MLTLEKLTAYGADVQTGLSRCMNREDFYLRLVNMELGDANFDKLDRAVKAGEAREAFEAAHALKGVLGNLSLTPLFTPVAELTEKLRGAQDTSGAGELPERIADQLAKLKALAE